MTNILIVGADEGSVSLIKMLSVNQSIKIVGVVDADQEAPGARLAKELGIPTSTHWMDFINKHGLDEVINLTNGMDIHEALAKEKPDSVILIDGKAIKTMRYLAEECAKTAKVLKNTEEDLEMQKWGLTKTNEAIKLLYKELAEKNRKLQELDQLKSDFLSTVSHELQTPLAIMKEYALLVLDEIPGKLTSGQREYIDIVIANIDRLSRLIKNLLDISKIEARKVEVKKALVNIIDLADGIISSFRIKAGQKNIGLKTNFSSPRINLQIDSDKITQIFTNLIGNAIKFTPENGLITISITDNKKEVECSVADTGAGIAAKDLDKVFTKFQQFNRAAGPGPKGTGLGLAISKELVLLHNGNIWVDSEPDKGSTFVFTLPR